MPCPHFDIRVVQRSEGDSAVAAAAYQSGEKLYSQYDRKFKNYEDKEGVTHTEIMLPPNAPREYADRSTLWNAVEKIENQWNSQLARRFHLIIPREIPPDQYVKLVKEYCDEFFVSKGMIADIAIHDPHPPGHNPHAHVLLTMRAMDENGKWLPKARKVYDLDENGEKIRLPSGNWKSHKENTVDWNERKYGMIWRMGWQDVQNKYLEANGRPERVDLRSYEAQGIDQIPTVHMGPAVTAMERRGIQTDIGNLNREIRKTNSIMQSIKKIIANLRDWIVELNECRKELAAEQAAYEASLLPGLLMKYLDIRKDERKDWTPHGRSKAASQDLKKVTEAIGYLKRQRLHTVDDLEAHIENSGKEAADLRGQMRVKEKRVKTIDSILLSLETYKECKPVYEQYQKIYFKKSKEKFKQEHPEIAKFERARAVLNKHPEAKTTTAKELKKESAELLDEIAELRVPLEEVQADLQRLKDIRYWVRKATPGTEESKEAPQKQSLHERLAEHSTKPTTQEQKPQRKQNMEL